MTTTTRELKELRAYADELIVLLDQFTGSREISLAKTKLQEGKMHIGNALGEIGESPSPYTESSNPANTTIEPYHKDVEVLTKINDWNTNGHIGNVKVIRRELNHLVVRVKEISSAESITELLSEKPFVGLYLGEIIIKFRESTNWMGMELMRIRDTSTN